MGSVKRGLLEGKIEGTLNDSSLVIAAAHELSSPLVLLRQLGLSVSRDTLSDDERQQLAQRLILTTERALRMAASLSMTAVDQQQFDLEPLNPQSVCQDVVQELTPLFAAHDQKIILRQRSRSPLLVGNRQLLRQILLGFGDNALSYGSESMPVRMDISSRKDRVRIGVRDYGPALPTDLWRRVEERATHHASTPLATRPYISALSLIAAKRLAEVMGSAVGTIRHRDGATFYIDLRLSGQMSML